MLKKDVRKQLIEMLKGLTTQQISQKSRVACEKLCQTEIFKNAQTIMMFLSIPHEIDTTFAAQQALQVGKTLVMPRIEFDTRHMTPLQMTSMDCPLEQDRYGLRHPASEIIIEIKNIDLVITPGLAFDAMGNRLGRGGGFYDRFLENGFSGTACGFGFCEQLLDTIPINKNDIPIHMLVTDTTVRQFCNKG